MNFVRRAVQRLRRWRPEQRLALHPRLYAYLGPDLALTQLVDGHFIYVDPADEQIAPHLIAHGYWEDWIDSAIRRLVAPGDRVVEVGANFGYYTLRMARAVGPRGGIEAFEASPYLAGMVARSVRFNNYAGRVRVHALAVGDTGGELSFSVSRRDGGSGHIAVDGELEGEGAARRELITVPCVRLDDLVEGPVDLLRMDAEGSEPLVLEGARELLARSPDIRICMEWSTPMMAARKSVPELVSHLRVQGFRFWLVATDGSFPELSDEALLALPLNEVLIARRWPFRPRD